MCLSIRAWPTGEPIPLLPGRSCLNTNHIKATVSSLAHLPRNPLKIGSGRHTRLVGQLLGDAGGIRDHGLKREHVDDIGKSRPEGSSCFAELQYPTLTLSAGHVEIWPLIQVLLSSLDLDSGLGRPSGHVPELQRQDAICAGAVGVSLLSLVAMAVKYAGRNASKSYRHSNRTTLLDTRRRCLVWCYRSVRRLQILGRSVVKEDMRCCGC